jgi:hypothetical protein
MEKDVNVARSFDAAKRHSLGRPGFAGLRGFRKWMKGQEVWRATVLPPCRKIART